MNKGREYDCSSFNVHRRNTMGVAALTVRRYFYFLLIPEKEGLQKRKDQNKKARSTPKPIGETPQRALWSKSIRGLKESQKNRKIVG